MHAQRKQTGAWTDGAEDLEIELTCDASRTELLLLWTLEDTHQPENLRCKCSCCCIRTAELCSCESLHD